MIVCGLDVATKTGWCRHNGTRYETGVVDCSKRESDEPDGLRYLRLHEALPAILDGVDVVVVEQPFSNSMKTAQVLGGLIAVVLVATETAGARYMFVPAPTLKAYGRSMGMADKDEMHVGAQKKLRRKITNDEADAYWLVRYFYDRVGG